MSAPSANHFKSVPRPTQHRDRERKSPCTKQWQRRGFVESRWASAKGQDPTPSILYTDMPDGRACFDIGFDRHDDTSFGLMVGVDDSDALASTLMKALKYVPLGPENLEISDISTGSAMCGSICAEPCMARNRSFEHIGRCAGSHGSGRLCQTAQPAALRPSH